LRHTSSSTDRFENFLNLPDGNAQTIEKQDIVFREVSNF